MTQKFFHVSNDCVTRGEDLAAPKEIVDLVEQFENILASYKSGYYNETQVRREFVDPFFKAKVFEISTIIYLLG